jgi:hypothetical protein
MTTSKNRTFKGRGNPDFGVRYKSPLLGDEPRNRLITIRFTPNEERQIKELFGDDYRAFCRDLILTEVKKRTVG